MPIDNLQKPVKLAADLWKQYWEIKNSGQPFKTQDALKFLDELLQLPDIFQSGDEIGNEVKNITPAEIDAIIQSAINQVGNTAGAFTEKFVAIMNLVGAAWKLQLTLRKPEIVQPVLP